MTTELEESYSIERFEKGHVDPESFNHEAHVYVGWLYVREFGLTDAIARFDSALKRLTAMLGVPEKYHATITWLFLMLIEERSNRDDTWKSFRSRNTDLIDGSKETLDRYYSETRLFSNRAREHFVLPDRLPV